MILTEEVLCSSRPVPRKEEKPHISLIASGASSSEMPLVDPAQVAKFLHKDDRLSGKLKIKKSFTKSSKAKDAESSCKGAHLCLIR